MVVSGGCAGSNSGRIHCDVGSSATSAGSKQLGFGHTGSDWRHSGGSDNSSPSPMQLSTLALQTWTEVWKWRKTRELRIRRNQPSLVISLAHGVATGRRSNIGAWSWDLGSGQLSWRHVDGVGHSIDLLVYTTCSTGGEWSWGISKSPCPTWSLTRGYGGSAAGRDIKLLFSAVCLFVFLVVYLCCLLCFFYIKFDL